MWLNFSSFRSDEYLVPFIKEIIDHRPQAKNFDSGIEVEIDIVGSCVTLIAERVLKAIQLGNLRLTEDEFQELSTLINLQFPLYFPVLKLRNFGLP